MRTRMSWDWIGDYPIFIYTTFIDNSKFNVKVVKGKKGDQNAKGYGPKTTPWFEYIETGCISKNAVVKKALAYVKQILNGDKDMSQKEIKLIGVKNNGEPARLGSEVVKFVADNVEIRVDGDKVILSRPKAMYTLNKHDSLNIYTGICNGIKVHFTKKKLVGKLIYWVKGE